jgi:hypothetical protein
MRPSQLSLNPRSESPAAEADGAVNFAEMTAPEVVVDSLQVDCSQLMSVLGRTLTPVAKSPAVTPSQAQGKLRLQLQCINNLYTGWQRCQKPTSLGVAPREQFLSSLFRQGGMQRLHEFIEGSVDQQAKAKAQDLMQHLLQHVSQMHGK